MIERHPKWCQRALGLIVAAGVAHLFGLAMLTARAESPTVSFAGVPLFFEPISAEVYAATNPSVPADQQFFLARGRNYQFLIAPTEVQVVLRKIASPSPFSPLERDQLVSPRTVATRNLRIEFVGANRAAATRGEDEMGR